MSKEEYEKTPQAKFQGWDKYSEWAAREVAGGDAQDLVKATGFNPVASGDPLSSENAAAMLGQYREKYQNAGPSVLPTPITGLPFGDPKAQLQRKFIYEAKRKGGMDSTYGTAVPSIMTAVTPIMALEEKYKIK